MKEYRVLNSLCKYLIEKKPTITVNDTKYVVGAFALDSRGVVISKGCNSFVKTHPMQKKYADKVGLHYKIYLHC